MRPSGFCYIKITNKMAKQGRVPSWQSAVASGQTIKKKAPRSQLLYAHTHTHTHIYVCKCVCVPNIVININKSQNCAHTHPHTHTHKTHKLNARLTPHLYAKKLQFLAASRSSPQPPHPPSGFSNAWEKPSIQL